MLISIFNIQDFQESNVIQKQTNCYTSLGNLQRNNLSTGSLQMSEKVASEVWELLVSYLIQTKSQNNHLHWHLAKTKKLIFMEKSL